MSNSKEVLSLSKDEKELDTWAKEAASGGDHSFSRLVEYFTPVLFSMISPLAVPETEKEDLMQEGLIGLYKAVRLFDPSLSSFATFARICMRSALLDGVKKYQKRGADLDLADWEETIPASLTETPERIFLGREELQELMERVDRTLSPMERRVFGLSLQGKGPSRIAAELGLGQKSVENTLYRLRKKLSAPV